MTYGFYATMGGFVADVREIHDSLTRVTLTPTGIATLAENGHFVQISDDFIRDKSKADVLAKGLVILQVTWMVVQCIGRQLSACPITLLEIHTLVHVVCTLIMYSLWFQVSHTLNDIHKRLGGILHQGFFLH
jgi:hypothetical protein